MSNFVRDPSTPRRQTRGDRRGDDGWDAPRSARLSRRFSNRRAEAKSEQVGWPSAENTLDSIVVEALAGDEWATTSPVLPPKSGGSSPLLRGLETIIDRAVPLLSESDEQLLLRRMEQPIRERTGDFVAVCRHFILDRGSTKANCELAVLLLTALYEHDSYNARSIVRQMLLSRLTDNIDSAVRIISEVDDRTFIPELQQILYEDRLPTWLMDTVEETVEELQGL